MIERLTSEQAKTVELSRNPFRRSQLAEYGSAFNTTIPESAFPHLPQYLTRGDLVRAAESREKAEFALRACEVASQVSLEQGEE